MSRWASLSWGWRNAHLHAYVAAIGVGDAALIMASIMKGSQAVPALSLYESNNLAWRIT